MLSMRELEIFWAVMRTGSMTNAARLLGVSQPAISRFMRHAEDQLGLKLFHRKNGRLSATAEAETLFPMVENIFQSIEVVRRTSLDLRDSLSGRIKVAAIPTFVAELIPTTLRTFLEKRPLVQVGVKIVPSRQVIDRVIRQQVDLGILYGPIVDSSLTVLDLCSTEIVAVVPRHHDLAEKDAVTPEDLADERLISVTAASTCGLLVEEAFTSRGVKRNTVVECHHSLTAYSLVEAGVGIAVVEPLLADHFGVPDVVVKPFRPKVEIRPQLIYGAGRPLSRLNRAFVSQLALTAAGLPLVTQVPAAPQKKLAAVLLSRRGQSEPV